MSMMYSTFNNKSFFTNYTIIFEPSTSGSYTLLTATSVHVIVSAICLTFMIRKLTVNKFIKISLCIMAIQNIIGSLLMTCSNISMLVYHQKSLLSCLFLTQPIIISTRSNWTFIAIISTLRYLMAWKASQTS